MKRTIALLLSLLLVFSMAGAFAGSASAEEFSVPAPPPADFEAQVEAQAFAAAMACWNSYYETSDTVWPMFGWEATGWYAAWLHRVYGVDLLPAQMAGDFQLAIGMAEELSSPEEWLGARAPAALRSADSSINYDFREFKLRTEELLGVELELNMTTLGDLTESVVITQHFGYREQADRSFLLRFEENPEPESAFAYRLVSVSIPDTEPEVDPNLTFTWDLLTEANSLRHILSLYPSVRSYSKEYDYGGSTWLFLHSGEPVLLTGGEGYYSGRYRGCDFEYGETADGSVRALIGAVDSGAQRSAGLDNFVLSVFSDPVALRLDRIEGDLIWADAIYTGGYRQKLAFDYGTLVLREAISLSEDGEVLGSTVYEYRNPAPELEFLKSWDAPLRDIRVIWEDYPNGVRQVREETVRVPQDWEYLPYEARWGDYTPYTNDQYLGDYAYPGDGEGYLLFLTTVKG